MRTLENFKGEALNTIIERVKEDHSLLFQIRDGYISVYYRGCSALKYDGTTITIDKEYTQNIDNPNTLEKWIEQLVSIKQNIDNYLFKHPSLEREFQQIVARANISSTVSNGTDYFIVDTEITDSERKSRFDMLAIKWPATGSDRKTDKKCRLAIIEMKYGIKAFGNLEDHLNNIIQSKKIEEMKETVLTQFKQLRELGLIQFSKDGNNNEVNNLAEEVEYILLFANYNPRSEQIKNHLALLEKKNKELKDKNIILKFATSSFMGYGLYENFMLSLEDFKELLEKRGVKN